MAEKGRQAGVPTPLNAAVAALAVRLERGELSPAVANFKFLAPFP